jgi:hypothetical protein
MEQKASKAGQPGKNARVRLGDGGFQRRINRDEGLLIKPSGTIVALLDGLSFARDLRSRAVQGNGPICAAWIAVHV